MLDASFAPYRVVLAAVERLYTGCRWAEGPVWFGDAGALLWSDIPNNRILRWDEETGVTSIFRKPSNNANGNTRDRQGRLVTCEHGTRRVTRTEYDGTITVLADHFDGKRLNSPNDVVVKSDGSIWFSDPDFGIGGYYEGEKAERELPTNVYRIDGQTGALTIATAEIGRPQRPRLLPRRAPLLRRRVCRLPPPHPWCSTCPPTAKPSSTAAPSSTPAKAPRTVFGWISTAISGAAGAWATAWTGW